MNPHEFVLQGYRLALAALIAMVVLAGCSGDDGAPGPAGPPGTPGTGIVPKSAATALSISITGVTINSPPVVHFTVTNEDSFPVGGLTISDLRFTLAKLMPSMNGSPSKWQSYIVTTETAETGPGSGETRVQATREDSGTLVDNLNGSYSYTFQTDITSVVCPAPCEDADGNLLDLSYQPNFTHRLGIQTRGDLPMVNGLYTFVPATGAVVESGREIVKTETCNECHNELEAHDARIETGYCVICHNPGSTDAQSRNTVDFKVMIHKIHRSADLPSVVNGVPYSIYGFNPATRNGDLEYDFSDIEFPQDIRNCTKCHDGSTSSEGDAWQTPSIAGCGSCHDDVDFSTGANHGPPGNEGGAQTDITCLGCHKIDGTGIAPSAAQAHIIPASAPKVASGKFQYNIIAICGTAVDADPVCAPNSTPTVTFSVSDPTGGIHGYGGNNTNYNIFADPEFTTAGASLNILTAWDTRDYTNEFGTGTRPSRANSVGVLSLAAPDVVDDGTGVFTVEATAMDPIPDTAMGSGAIAMEGRLRGESVVGSGNFDIRVPVKGEVAYFGITDTIPVARRVAVDIEYKCDNCHDLLSEHGDNRAENAQLCVLCHNPRGTDVERRDTDDPTDGIPNVSPLDGKWEESIDLRRLIHGIHAAQKDDPSTPEIEGYGFREKGLVVAGHEYGHVRFPGILSDCTTCHNSGTYELKGIWETPTQNDILASTIKAAPSGPISPDNPSGWADLAAYESERDSQLDDLTISPTAAVCSACHDSELAQVHMEDIGGAQFDVLQSAITGRETCAICHGPGRSADVKVVHGVE